MCVCLSLSLKDISLQTPFAARWLPDSDVWDFVGISTSQPAAVCPAAAGPIGAPRNAMGPPSEECELFGTPRARRNQPVLDSQIAAQQASQQRVSWLARAWACRWQPTKLSCLASAYFGTNSVRSAEPGVSKRWRFGELSTSIQSLAISLRTSLAYFRSRANRLLRLECWL